MPGTADESVRRGMLSGIGAYLLWGLLPLYWRLLHGVPPMQILAHRIAWSLVFLGVVLRAFGKARAVPIERRQWKLLAIASVLVGGNWGLYIWGVSTGHVVETALGYFINPLFTVLLGVVVLRERLRRLQWIGLGVVALAVVVLTIAYGRPPWIALTLASTFAVYGFVKKRAAVDPVRALTIETAILVVPAAAYIAVVAARGEGAFGSAPFATVLLAVSGVVTAIPLVLLGDAANRLPLSVLGPLQYLSPTLQFLCGVLVFREPMPPSRWLGFGLVWFALVVFIAGSRRSR